MVETDEEPKIDEGLLALIQEHFAPHTGAEVTRRTTAEITKVIDSHAPATYHSAEVYQVLHHLQYRTQMVDNVLYWLVGVR